MDEELLHKAALPVMIVEDDEVPGLEDEENIDDDILDDEDELDDDLIEDEDDEDLVDLGMIFGIEDEPDENGYEEEEEEEEDEDLYGDDDDDEEEEDDEAFYEDEIDF